VTKEEIYDAQIDPLMAQILVICKANKIAMIADFSLDDEDDLHCTSATLEDEFSPGAGQLQAFEILKPKRKSFCLAETIETKSDGHQHITIKRIS
jgi:hypothetical protein